MIRSVNRSVNNFKYSGRSTDYIPPSFGFGCLADCLFCYMKRHKYKGLDLPTNTTEILEAIDQHVPNVKKPNQTDSLFYTYDIGVNEDLGIHVKFHDWEQIFTFFRDHPTKKASFATKGVPEQFLQFNPSGKVRIRFTLVPEPIRPILERGTKDTYTKLQAINAFIAAGYEVHLNYSPVVVYKEWLADYEDLFIQVKHATKHNLKSEVIFLTHNVIAHERNIDHPGENLIWKPDIQENKISSYGSCNIRYKRHLKADFIKDFKNLHNKILPNHQIRYIF